MTEQNKNHSSTRSTHCLGTYFKTQIFRVTVHLKDFFDKKMQKQLKLQHFLENSESGSNSEGYHPRHQQLNIWSFNHSSGWICPAKQFPVSYVQPLKQQVDHRASKSYRRAGARLRKFVKNIRKMCTFEREKGKNRHFNK